jgi:hypothetical protein
VINEKTTERDIWWKRLRNEIEKNAASLNCNYIIGYREIIHVFESIMIMSVSGTAVKIKHRHSGTLNKL